MIFGSVERIHGVVDAAPIPDLQMVLVLDASGCLSLYSGTMRVGKTILSHNVNTVLTQVQKFNMLIYLIQNYFLIFFLLIFFALEFQFVFCFEWTKKIPDDEGSLPSKR